MPNTPPSAKKPQDRLPSKAARAEAEGRPVHVDFNGSTYTIDREHVDDVELMEKIAEMAEGASYLLPVVVHKMLGDEQWSAFKDANRNDAGRVPSSALESLFDALNSSLGESRASQPS